MLNNKTLPSLREETRLPPPRGFLNYDYELYLKQPLTPPQWKMIAAYRTLNHRLAIGIDQWSTILISRDTRLCHFCSYNAVEYEAHSC